MIKKLQLLIAGCMTLAIVGFAIPATAASFDLVPACQDHADAAVCSDANAKKNTIYGPDGIITKIANIIAIIVGIAAVIVIMVAGIQYMLSTGDPTKVNNAKNAIIYAVVGLVVAVFARTIVVFFVSKLK